MQRIRRRSETMRVNGIQTSRQTDRGGGLGGVNGPVSSMQVSLLRVLCPNTLLSPYLLPLSSADAVCLDCSSPSLSSLLSLSPHLYHSYNSNVCHECKELVCQTYCPNALQRAGPTAYMLSKYGNIY